MNSSEIPPHWSRRGLLGLGCAAGLSLAVGSSLAAPAGDKRLSNRLELWSTFARGSTNLLAHYTSTRTSPLLREALVGSGELAFIAPGTLVLRDGDATGSTTRIDPRTIEVSPNDPSLPQRALPTRANAPALRWLAARLVACFAPGDGSALTSDARVEVPRGRARKLQLLPPRDSAARSVIRSLTLTLEQVGGAVVNIQIDESDGSSFVLALADHRQRVEDALITRVTG